MNKSKTERKLSPYIVSSILMRFSAGFIKNIREFNTKDSIYIIDNYIQIIQKFINNEDPFKITEFYHKNLLEKFGKKFESLHSVNFFIYFNRGILLTTFVGDDKTDIYTLNEYNSLDGEDEGQILTEIEFDSVRKGILSILYRYQSELYLDEEELGYEEILLAIGDANYTQNIRMLIIYYLLMGYGIHLRFDVNITVVARLMHILMGKKITKIQNSDIYKKLRKDFPFNKEDKHLKEDLIVVKNIFLELQLDKIVAIIDNHIKDLEK